MLIVCFPKHTPLFKLIAQLYVIPTQICPSNTGSIRKEKVIYIGCSIILICHYQIDFFRFFDCVHKVVFVSLLDYFSPNHDRWVPKNFLIIETMAMWPAKFFVKLYYNRNFVHRRVNPITTNILC